MGMSLRDFGRGLRTEEPGVLQSLGSQRVRYDLATEQQQYLKQESATAILFSSQNCCENQESCLHHVSILGCSDLHLNHKEQDYHRRGEGAPVGEKLEKL